MRTVDIRSCVAGLLLGLVFFRCSVGLADTKEHARWSINFSAVSISEALNQLTQMTGIKIFTKTPLDRKISPKVYTNQSIDQILKDLLRGVNYAAVWHYGEKGVDSIGILIFDRGRGESSSNLSGVKRAGTMNRSLPRGPGSKQLHPRRQVSGPEKALRRGLSDKRVQGASAEGKDEESISSSTEVNDAFATGASDTQVETTTDSSSEEEGSPPDQENEGEQSGPSASPEEKHGDEE